MNDNMKKIASLLIGMMTLSGSLAAEPGKLKREFYTGEIRLTKSMFDSSAFGRDELRALYKNGEWEKLVSTVISKRAAWDTYYFYLGRAAEELGYKRAALTYYELAINSDKYKKCDMSSMINLCDGFKFPDAAQARIDQLTVTDEKFWELDKAPLLSDLTKIAPEPIDVMAKKPDQASFVRSKFETDEEFAHRKASAQQSYFLAAPLVTKDGGKCASQYDHAGGYYLIQKCLMFSDSVPVLRLEEAGDKFSLANAYDKREIQRVIYRSYSVLSGLTWSGKYKLSRDEAAKLDPDLMVGIVFSKKISSARCDICESRELADASSELADVLSKTSGRRSANSNSGWKDQAFKEGTLEEYWEHKIVPKDISKIYVYRKSDMRVIYERDTALSKE